MEDKLRVTLDSKNRVESEAKDLESRLHQMTLKVSKME